MSDNRKNSKKDEVPIWFKPTLSIEETSRYSGIGMSKLYELTNPEDCPFVLWIGTRRMIKRRKFDEYIERVYSIWGRNHKWIARLIAKENGKKIFESNVVASKRIKKANIVELYLRYIGEFIGGYYIFNSSN